MALTEQGVPFVVPVPEPPAPPPIPVRRTLGRAFVRAWPFLAWAGSVLLAFWLYFGEAWHGHALAFQEIAEVRVSPSVPGRLSRVELETGQEVKEGDLVALLETRDLDARIRLAKTETELLRTRVGAEREAIRLDHSDRRSQAAARLRDYESEEIRLRLLIEKLSTEQATDHAESDAIVPQIDRLKPLMEGRLVTAERFEELSRTRAVLEKRLASRAGEIRGARREREEWAKRAPEGLPEAAPDARLLPFESELRAQELRVEELALEREKYRVLAPATGRVSLVSGRPGEWIGAGAPIAEIVVPRPKRVIAYLTERQIPVVAVGTKATLRPRDHGGPALEGRVIVGGPRMEPAPSRLRALSTVAPWGRLVTIEVGAPAELLPGEIYDVRFH